MTRSLTDIWRGRVLLSLRYHPLGLPLFGICLCTLLFAAIDRWFPRFRPHTTRLRALFMHTATLSAIAAFMVALWLMRLLLDKTGPHLFLW